MNNKYDVQNFSKLIDDFSLDSECQLIDIQIQNHMANHKYTTMQTIFDPVISDNINESKYNFASFQGKKYDVMNIN